MCNFRGILNTGSNEDYEVEADTKPRGIGKIRRLATKLPINVRES